MASLIAVMRCALKDCSSIASTSSFCFLRWNSISLCTASIILASSSSTVRLRGVLCVLMEFLLRSSRGCVSFLYSSLTALRRSLRARS